MMNAQRLFYYVVLLLLKVTYFHVSAKQNYFISKQWILENMPFLPIIFAKSEYLPDGRCKEDTQRLLYDLLNGSTWATQMFDSSTKYPEGIFYGHTRHLGNFDECYNLQVTIVEENTNTREINGKYCFVNIEYKREHAICQKLLFNATPISVSKYQNETSNSFWNLIEQLEDFLHTRGNCLQLALCVPATCNAENVEAALRIPLEQLGTNNNVKLKTTVQSCQTAKEAPKYTFGAGLYCAVILVLLSLVIISTWYDSMSNKDRNHTTTMGNIMIYFSARKNYAKILHVNYTHTGLDSIYFIRLVNMVFVVYLHNLMRYIYNPTVNTVDIEKCVLHGWYLAADFQLFVCSQFVIYAFWCMPRKIGYPFLGILTLISCTIPFVATYIYGASSVLRITPYMTKVTTKEFEEHYIKGHMYITGYLVGIIAGAILYDHKGSTWRLSKYWSHILVCPIPLIFYISIQYWAYKFLILDNTNQLEEAIFAFFFRLIVALCLCSTIVLLSIGSQSEFYYNFLTPRWTQPLANLCYGVYLVHMIFVIIDIGQIRTARTFSIEKTVWDTISLLIISFLISLLLAICIEMPFRSLSKWLFSESSMTVVEKNNTIVDIQGQGKKKIKLKLK